MFNDWSCDCVDICRAIQEYELEEQRRNEVMGQFEDPFDLPIISTPAHLQTPVALQMPASVKRPSASSSDAGADVVKRNSANGPSARPR